MLCKLRFSILLIIAVLISSSQSKTILIPLTKSYEDGKKYDCFPGDTLLVEAGRRPAFHLKHFHGSADKKIVVINQGGQVLIGKEHYYGFTIDSCSHLHITGTGDPQFKYGFKVDGTASGVGFGIGGLSTNIEVEHMEICSTGFAGIMAKKDFSGNPPVPPPVFEGLSIHDNYIHDTGGEGMYIGETKSPGMEFKNVRIYNNLVVRTGWDCFQIANAVEDVEVYNNVFYRGGLEAEQYQQNGFQIGDNTVGLYYNNIIMHAPGNGFIVMGSGNISIYNNYIQDFQGSAVFIDNRNFTIDNTSIEVKDNYICEINAANPMFGVYNELNEVIISGNQLEGSNLMIRFASGAGPANVKMTDTSRSTVQRISFKDTTNFQLSTGSPYEGLGLLQEGTSSARRPATLSNAKVTFTPNRVFTLSGRKTSYTAVSVPGSRCTGLFLDPQKKKRVLNLR